jgi:hypothetical protein
MNVTENTTGRLAHQRIELNDEHRIYYNSFHRDIIHQFCRTRSKERAQ